MIPKVLIIDDDSAWLRLLQKELEPYADTFKVLVAQDAKTAFELLKREHVAIVVTDLRMPGVDGFDLLNKIMTDFPDIAVITMTAFDRPKTRDVVIRSGASEYLTKPFSGAYLADRIVKVLKKNAEGGSLHNVSLETFLQLVEMEQQTCTLRVTNRIKRKIGVLFFRNGELMNARVGDLQGKDAAYEILSWSGVSLFIENSCPLKEKKIEESLQAILLDAMRSKDEKSDEAAKSGVDDMSEPSVKPALKPSVAVSKISRTIRAADILEESQNTRSAQGIRKRIETALGPHSGVDDVYEDSAWSDLIYQASRIGECLNAGFLNLLYLNKGPGGQFIIVNSEVPVTVRLNSDTPRDRVMDLLV